MPSPYNRTVKAAGPDYQMWGSCSEKFLGPTTCRINMKSQMKLKHCKNEEIFSRLHMRNLCIQQCIHSTIVCSDMFSLFLLTGNLDLIIFLAHVCEGP